MNFTWKSQFSSLAHDLVASEIREILKIAARPDIISFAGGIPASELFPYEEIRAAHERILTDPVKRAQALQYSITEGYQPLRELIYQDMKASGVNLSLNNVCVTSGSQQALGLLSQVFIDQGDKVIVESPSYLGALQAFSTRRPHYLTIATDDDGMRVEDLEPLMKQHPKFIYTVPVYHNPAGITLSWERRQQLVALAHQYNVPVIEDNAYIQLGYDGKHIPPIIEIDAVANDCHVDNTATIYLGSASKILAPGFRTAWVVAPTAVIDKIVKLKQSADLHSSTINQMMVHELLTQPFFIGHLETLKRTYNERRTIMLNAMAEHFPVEVHWTQPTGGMFIWVKLPPSVNTRNLLEQSIERIKVAYVPGASFFADHSGKNTLRLSFTSMQPDKIQEGIEKLGGLLKRIVHEESVYQPS